MYMYHTVGGSSFLKKGGGDSIQDLAMGGGGGTIFLAIFLGVLNLELPESESERNLTN